MANSVVLGPYLASLPIADLVPGQIKILLLWLQATLDATIAVIIIY